MVHAGAGGTSTRAPHLNALDPDPLTDQNFVFGVLSLSVTVVARTGDVASQNF